MAETVALADLPETSHVQLFPDSEPKAVRLELDAGERVDPHTHSDREVLFLLLDGRLDLDLDDETHELAAGDVTRFDGRREVSPRAVEASRALVVLAHRAD